jgi:hypothetical protein
LSIGGPRLCRQALPQFAAGREETVGDLDESHRRQSPVDLLNSEEFHEEAYTSEFVNPIGRNFVFVHFAMFWMKIPEEKSDGVPAMLCLSFARVECSSVDIWYILFVLSNSVLAMLLGSHDNKKVYIFMFCLIGTIGLDQ